MITPDPIRDPAVLPGSTTYAGRVTREPAINRFLGGSPGAVFLRLVFISLIVGALLMWLDIQPVDIFASLDRFARRLWAMGFDGLRVLGQHLVAGAIFVVPIWLVVRLMGARGDR